MSARKVFVFFSPSLNELYFGKSEDYTLKLIKMNSGYYDVVKAMPQATDWEVKIVVNCKSLCQAAKILKHLSNKPNRSYINNLASRSGLIQRLLERFCDQEPN